MIVTGKKPTYSEINLSQRHLIHHKSHTDFRVNINLRYTKLPKYTLLKRIGYFCQGINC